MADRPPDPTLRQRLTLDWKRRRLLWRAFRSRNDLTFVTGRGRIARDAILAALGSQGINFSWVAMLLLGGVIAAPIAAWLVRTIPPRVLGSAVGGIIVLTNSKTILESVGVTGAPTVTAYVLILALWIGAVAWSVRAHRAEVAADAAATDGETERELVGEPA